MYSNDFNETELRYFLSWKRFFKDFLNLDLKKELWSDFYKIVLSNPYFYKTLTLILKKSYPSTLFLKKYSDIFNDIISFCKEKELIDISILNQETKISSILKKIETQLKSPDFKNISEQAFILEEISLKDFYLTTPKNSPISGWDLLYTELTKITLNLDNFDFYMPNGNLWSENLKKIQQNYSIKMPKENVLSHNSHFQTAFMDYFLRSFVADDKGIYSYSDINESSSSNEIAKSFSYNYLKLESLSLNSGKMVTKISTLDSGEHNDSDNRKIRRIRKNNQNIPIRSIELEMFLGKAQLKKLNELSMEKLNEFFYLKEQRNLNNYFNIEFLKSYIYILIVSSYKVYGFEYLLNILKQINLLLIPRGISRTFNNVIIECLLNSFLEEPERKSIDFLFKNFDLKTSFESQTFNDDQINFFTSLLTYEIRNQGLEYTSNFKSAYKFSHELKEKNIGCWINNFL